MGTQRRAEHAPRIGPRGVVPASRLGEVGERPLAAFSPRGESQPGGIEGKPANQLGRRTNQERLERIPAVQQQDDQFLIRKRRGSGLGNGGSREPGIVPRPSLDGEGKQLVPRQ